MMFFENWIGNLSALCSQSLGPNTHMQKFSTQFVDRYCSVLCKQQAGHNVFKLFLECLVELHG